MTRTMLTTQLFAAAAMLLVTVGTLPAAAQTFDAAVEAYKRGDYATALAGFQNDAEQGNAEAQLNLGVKYANGEGVPEDAAEQGHAAAQLNLGVKYANGEGVPEDAAEAVRWYRLAAEQGTATAQFLLGFMYANGKGVPEDAAEAVRWYRLAAEQGYARAQLNLGVKYAIGEGVLEDAVYAYAWLSIAAAQGNTNAKEGKELVTKRMTQAQITEAQKRSRKYWTRYVVPFQ